MNMNEKGYIENLRNILENGETRKDRTGTGTVSLFAPPSVKYELTDSFPLLTTKRVAWKSCLKELLWFIAGDTDAKTLQKQGVKIWDGNTSREYLDSVGLTDFPEGSLGYGYGFQWRNFNGEMNLHTKEITKKGVDQLQNCIDLIRSNPTSRRIYMTAWNPSQLHLMALPPCHVSVQFYVRNNEYLDSCLYQRSTDSFLGEPFNLASYGMLTCMIAKITNLKPGVFTHAKGDSHIYLDHIPQVKEQINREIREPPKLVIQGDQKEIDHFKFEDFSFENYNPHPSIKAKMSV